MTKIGIFGAIALGIALSGCTLFERTPGPDRTKYLDEFDLTAMSCGMGKRPQARLTILGKPLRLGEKTYARGVGTHSESVMLLHADGEVRAFDAIVGIDRETQEYPASWRTGKNWGSCSFRVYADWKLVYDSGVIREKDPPKTVHVDLRGAEWILLECSDGGHWAGYLCGHGDWADARFTLADGAELEPVADHPRLKQLGVLTPPMSDSPRINGADAWGVRPGHPIVYRIPVSGARPMEVDLYTVIGYPRARYLRFSTDRLGVPSPGGGYRFQFRRIVVERERLTGVKCEHSGPVRVGRECRYL